MFDSDLTRPVVDSVTNWLTSPTLISAQLRVYQFAWQSWLLRLLTVPVAMALAHHPGRRSSAQSARSSPRRRSPA